MLLVTLRYLKIASQILVHFAFSTAFFVILGPAMAPILFSGLYVMPDVVGKKRKSADIGEKIESPRTKQFVSELCEECNINPVELRKTSGQSGVLLQRLWEKDVILVPESTRPEDCSEESLVVISHEIAHKKNKDSAINYFLVLILSVTVGFLCSIAYATSIPTLVVTILLCSLVSPLFLNYISHRSEYRADSFAVEKVSKQAVIDRLLTNNHLSSDNRFPYETSHPAVQDRVKKIKQND